MLKVFNVFITLIILVFGFLPLDVFAIANPTSTSILDVTVFDSVSVTGDQLWFVRYNVNYATVPSEPASTTFSMAISDVADTTILYQRALNYYQENIISIYLTPAQALVSGGAYIVRIAGNPALFTLIEGINKATTTLAAGDYYSGDEVTLGGYMLTQADILETDWGITLLTASGLLNTTGTIYFTIAIPGLTSIVPSIFQISSSYPDVETPGTNTTYSSTVEAHRGPNLDAMVSEWASFLGTSKSWVSVGFTSFICCLLMGVVYGATQNTGWAVVIGALFIPVAVWMGLLELTIFILIVAICALFVGWIFIMGKSF